MKLLFRHEGEADRISNFISRFWPKVIVEYLGQMFNIEYLDKI